MKANEAPEKLYFGEVDKGILDIYSTKESDNEVEYTSTDAFIEKAAKWVKERAELFLLKTPMCDYYDYKKAVKDFEKYMKGE